jgi:hypothetical protein
VLGVTSPERARTVTTETTNETAFRDVVAPVPCCSCPFVKLEKGTTQYVDVSGKPLESGLGVDFAADSMILLHLDANHLQGVTQIRDRAV